jgi:hypothetical protein
MAKWQKQAPPISASDCHRRDPVAANAGLMMQQVQERRRRLEIEPRRPCAGAEPEPVPEMARRQAMSESETMQPAREQLVLRRDHLRRPAFGRQSPEPRLHLDRGAGMIGQSRGTVADVRGTRFERNARGSIRFGWSSIANHLRCGGGEFHS